MSCRAVCALAVAVLGAAVPAAGASLGPFREVVSLDGTWQAEVAPDAQGETLPTAFTRTIPVPGHWPLMKPSAPCGKTEALWCRTTWKAPAAIPPRAFFSQIKSIGWDSFRQCISAPPDFWYDLCDEMGLLIQVQFAADGISVEAFEMSAPGDKKPWVEIDLGEERDVTSCKIHWFRVWKKPPAKWRVTPTLPPARGTFSLRFPTSLPTSSPPLRRSRSIGHAQTDSATLTSCKDSQNTVYSTSFG